MEKIILLGGGGHAKVLIESIRLSMRFEIEGILDRQLSPGTTVSGIKVLGDDNLLGKLYKSGIKNACIAIGSVRDNSKRKALFDRAIGEGYQIPCIVHPRTFVSESARLADGVQIMAGGTVQTDAVVGENTIINTGSIIDHDCLIGMHVHICPGVVISGGCVISEAAFIGAGSTIIQGIKIGMNAVVAAGAVVVKNVPAKAIVAGVPAK